MPFLKNWNWQLEINIGDETTPNWKAFENGVQSYGQAISDSSQEYYYIAGRGAPETVNEGVSEAFTVSGHRNIGDEVQDWIFEHERVWNLRPDIRNVPFRYYNTISGQGETGVASISYTTTGSGEAQGRSVIGLVISVMGVPEVYYNGFRVIYNANGGAGEVLDTTIYKDSEEAVIKESSPLTNGSKTFQEWNSTASGTGTAYSPGDKVPMTADITLYAQWT